MASIAKRDFEIYAKGIIRLEELEKEVNLLNLDKKFPAEIASIRSKLKHVSEIPQIEYELKLLKDKLAGKSKNKIVHKYESASKINALKEEIKRKAAECKRVAPLSKDVLKLKLEIETLRKKIKEYEEEKSRKNKILQHIDVGVEKVFDNTMDLSLNEIKAKLSKEVESKEAEVQKELNEDLKRRDELFNQKYSQLEQDFHEKYNLKVKNELKKEIQDKFETRVGQELLKKEKASQNEINLLKRKLKAEYASKEKILDNHFKKDILDEKKHQKELFSEKLLAQKIKMHKKLDSEIASEVMKIRTEESAKKHELNKKLSNFSKLKERLAETFRKKKDALENNEELIIRHKLGELESLKENALAHINAKQKSLDEEKKNFELLKENMLSKVRGEFEREKKLSLERIAEKQKELVAEKLKLTALKNRIILNAKKEMEVEKEDFEEEKRKEQEKLMRAESALKDKAELIKKRLQSEYLEKLKEAIKLKEQEFKRRNLDLEKEIAQKVKLFYK